MLTEKQVLALLNEVTKPRKFGKDGKNVGGLAVKNKKSGLPNFACDLIRYLIKNGGTIVWDFRDPLSGVKALRNMPRFLAAEIYGDPDPTEIDKRRNAADKYETHVRTALSLVSSWMLDKLGVTLYSCPRPGNKRLMGVLTIFGGFVVDEFNGLTAAEAMKQREMKATKSRLSSTANRIGMSIGDLQDVIEELRSTIDKIDAKGLPSPERDVPRLMYKEEEDEEDEEDDFDYDDMFN